MRRAIPRKARKKAPTERAFVYIHWMRRGQAAGSLAGSAAGAGAGALSEFQVSRMRSHFPSFFWKTYRNLPVSTVAPEASVTLIVPAS